MIRNRRILVTGAGGFVGTNLVRKLIRGNNCIHIFLRPDSDPWRLHEVLKQVKAHWVDLGNRIRVQRLVKNIEPEHIFHLAAYGGYPFQKESYRIVEENILGTVHLLEASLPIPYRSLVCAGTSSEYGPKRQPMREEDRLEPAHLYAAAKASSTLLCRTYARVYRKPITVLRLFSIYGPWEEPTRFIPTAICRLLRNRPIHLISGRESRDFVFVEDAVRAFELAALTRGAEGGIFNISSGQQWRTEEVAKLLLRIAKRKVPLLRGRYRPRPWETTYWVGSGALARRVLRWQPQVNLEDGLRKTMEWLESHLELYEHNR